MDIESFVLVEYETERKNAIITLKELILRPVLSAMHIYMGKMLKQF